MIHSFTIHLTNCTTISVASADLIYTHCPDALIVCSGGTVEIDFDREADTFDNAVNSALADLTHLNYEAQFKHKL